MTGKGWITGEDIRTRPPTKEYREGWERIFGNKRHNKDSPDGLPCSCGKPVDDPIHIPRIEI